MSDITFSWTMTAENKTRVIEGIAMQHGYQDQIADPDNEGEMIANPESKGDFALKMTKQWIIENVKAYEANKAAEEARAAKITEVESIELT